MLSPFGMAAVEYARRGWRVIPLFHVLTTGENPICGCYRRDTCGTPGKHPQIKNWRENASNDPVLVAQWWRVWPRANVGLLTGGLARLVAIDVDGETGRESWQALQDMNEPVPETLRQTTGREGGGEHFLFTVDDDFEMDKIRNRTKMAPGIDVRAEGGLIVAPPSIHPTGAQYAWRDANAPLASMPAWLIKIAVSQKARQIAITPNAGRPSEEALEADGWPRWRRALVARETLIREADPAISGRNGHGSCLKTTVLLIRGYCLYSDEAFDLLWNVYNPICVPPWSHEELMHKIESAEYAVSDESYPWRFRIPAPDPSPAGRAVQAIYDECYRELGGVQQLWEATPDTAPEPTKGMENKPKRSKRNTEGNVA